MLALAFKVPVYVIGMFGGAACAVGSLMGLSRTYQGVPICLCKETHQQNRDYGGFATLLEQWAPHFDVPNVDALPKSFDDLRRFLMERAIGRTTWIHNGLTSSENKDLFNTREADHCIELVVRGISRLGWHT